MVRCVKRCGNCEVSKKVASCDFLQRGTCNKALPPTVWQAGADDLCGRLLTVLEGWALIAVFKGGNREKIPYFTPSYI